MIKRTVKGLAVAIALVALLSGCFLFAPEYTVEIENAADAPIDFYYRLSGETEWTKDMTALSGYTYYTDLPGGTYEFRAVVSGQDVDDSGAILGTENDCTLDFHLDLEGDGYNTYDYSFWVSNSGVSFY